MSKPVALAELEEITARYGEAAFFVTTGDDGRAHVTHVSLRWVGAELEVDLGRRGAQNISVRSAAVMLWPPVEPNGFSLLVDVTAREFEGRARLMPTSAVLHRPAPLPT